MSDLRQYSKFFDELLKTFGIATPNISIATELQYYCIHYRIFFTQQKILNFEWCVKFLREYRNDTIYRVEKYIIYI